MQSATAKTTSEPKTEGLDGQLRKVLSRYLSTITVDTVLAQVYLEEQLTPDRMTRGDLERVFQSSLFMSVRMFCKSELLSDAMLDLAELLETIPRPKASPRRATRPPLSKPGSLPLAAPASSLKG